MPDSVHDRRPTHAIARMTKLGAHGRRARAIGIRARQRLNDRALGAHPAGPCRAAIRPKERGDSAQGAR